MIKALIAGLLTITGITGAYVYQDQVFGVAPNVLRPSQGGTGVGTATPSDVGKVLKVSDDSPFTYTLQDDNTGAGGSFPFTPTSWGNSTSTVLGNTLGFFANGSSTFNILRTQHATSTNLDVTGLLTFNGVTGSTWASFCTTITGSASLCDGNDATGGAGGTTVVSTSSSETSGLVPFWTSTNGTPAQLSGGVAGFAWSDTFKRLTATYSSSTVSSATTFYGALVGNADTATALAADPANCAAGNAPLGITTTGAVEGCFDVWTEAENTSAGYVAGTRALTVSGTANQITSSAGSQTLAADRTWTLSLPSHVIFPGSYVAGTGTTTNATSTFMNVVSHLRSEGTTRFDQLTSALVLTGSTGVAGEYTGANCTNQVIEDLDAVGSPTCRTITSSYVDSTIATFAYPFTNATSWFSTSTISLNTAGIMSTASSTLTFLDSVRSTSTNFTATNATTSALSIATVLSFGGVSGDAWTDFCTTITGSAALCDGNDASGTGGAAAVATSSSETATYVPFWTTTSGTPAQLSGGESTFTYDSSLNKLTVSYASSTSATISGNIYTSGNLDFGGGDVTAFYSANNITWSGQSQIQFESPILPASNDAHALGAAVAGNWSDLFLGDSGTINWNNGNVILTQSSNALSLSTNDLFTTTYSSTSALTVIGQADGCAQFSLSGLLTSTGSACGGAGNPDTVLWANASTSPWSVLSLSALSSSTIAFLDMVRSTSTDSISTNATTSVLSASSHIRSQGTLRVDSLTSALVLTGGTGLAAEYTGAGCTDQVIEDLDALGAPTCRTITSAYVDSTISTFGYPFTPATSWTATSTLMLNTGGFMSVASSTLTNLFSSNLSIASDGTLVIPASASPVVNATGEIALDTTSGNIIFATSTAQSLVLGGATTTLYAMVIASTSPDFASGGVIPLPAHFLKQQAVGIICKVDGGTSQQIFLSDAGSTNDSNTITCSTTETQYNFTTNNIWTAYEPIQLEFATKSGSPDYITIRIVGFRTSD